MYEKRPHKILMIQPLTYECFIIPEFYIIPLHDLKREISRTNFNRIALPAVHEIKKEYMISYKYQPNEYM